MGIDAKMFVRTRDVVTEAYVKESAWLLCAVFGADEFFVDRDSGRRALSIVSEFTQDGPTLTPEPGETFIHCHLFTRYWGPGYERGALGLIIGVAMWLEKRFPGGVVWYGGDSSGVCAIPFDAKARDEFIAHAASDRGADYRTLRNRIWGDPPQSCEFCGPQMTPCRWGGGTTGYVCMGCRLHRLVTKEGVIVGESTRGWPDEVKAASHAS